LTGFVILGANMTECDQLTSRILERLGREELELKRLGLVNHAAGVRAAIVAILKLVAEKPEPPPLIR